MTTVARDPVPPARPGRTPERTSDERELRRLARGSTLNLVGSLVAVVLNLVLPVVITRSLVQGQAGLFFQAAALFTILLNVGTIGADTGVLRSLPRAVALPLIVGAPDRRAGPPLVERAAAPLHRRDQASTLENAPDRRSRRPGGIRRLALKYRQNLARPQIRKSPPRRDHLLSNRTIRGLPTLQRRMRAIHEPCRIAALLPLPPFVKRVSANPIAAANLRYAPVPALVLKKHPNTFFHPTGLSKWHRRALPPMHSETCRGSSRSNLSGIYPVCTADRPPTPDPSPPRASARGGRGAQDTASRSRGGDAPEVCLKISAPRSEGAGNAGRPMRPIAACAMVERRNAHALVRSHRNHPAFPAQWF